MDRPSMRSTTRLSSVKLTALTLSSALRAKIPIPSLQASLAIFSDKRLYSIQLASGETEIGRQSERFKPELGGEVVSIDVHVRRLRRLVTEEVNSVRPLPEDSRQLFSPSDVNYRTA